MRIFLCVLLCVGSALGFPRPNSGVPPQCSDPTYACQDLESARQCHVVSSCIHDVWAGMSAPQDNDQICDICKEMVKEARDQLLSNMTQEEIKEVFEGSCKLLPVKLVRDACIKVVDEIIPQLVEMLASRMDPNMVCTVSGLCNMAHLPMCDNISKFVNILLPKDDQCAECTQMITDMQTFLKSSTEDEVKTYISKICDEKVEKYLCSIVMKEYFSEIYTYLKNSDAKGICSTAGVCPKTQVGDVPVKDELVCEFCTHVLEHVKEEITANTTAEEFKSALYNFCNITGKYASECTSLVTKYCDTVFAYIRKMDTKGLCTMIGLCGGNTTTPLVKIVPAFEPRRRIPLIRLQPAQPITDKNNPFQPMVRLIPADLQSKKELKESNNILQTREECAVCKAFTFFLEKDLNGVTAKAEIRKTVNNICSKWMSEYPEACDHFVKRYSMRLRHNIAKGMSFDDLCPQVKVCPLETQQNELKVTVMKSSTGRFCDLCKEAMTAVEKQLNDPATKQQLESFLGQGCSMLPQSMRDDCTNFVNSNVEALLSILQQEMQPNNICPALGFCPSSDRIEVTLHLKDLECDVCKDVVTNFRQKLQDPSSKVLIQTFLEEGCIRLPTSVAAECKKFVDENIDTVIAILVQEMDPTTVCAILKICPGSVHVVQETKVSDIECDLCKEVVGKVEDMVKDKKTEDEIKSALDKVCSYLPKSMTAKCDQFVAQYTDMVIQLLMQELDPATVCAELQICPGSVQVVQETKVSDIECDLCKEVVGKVEDMVKDKKTEDEIKSALDKVCSYLPKSMTAKCDQFVAQYTDMVIQLLMQELDPATVCAELQVCPASLRSLKKVSDMECDLCKEAMNEVDNYLKDPATEATIKQALEKVCSYLPSSMSAQCTKFMDQYAETVIHLLADELDPAMVCAALKVCPAQLRKAAPVLKEINDIDFSDNKPNNQQCQVCKDVIAQIESFIGDRKSEDDIKAALDKVCSILPSSFGTKCRKIVDTYSEIIITLLTKELDPDMICSYLHVCPANIHVAEWLSKAQDMQCETCQQALHFLQTQLMSEDTQAEVKNVLKQVCSLLPQAYSANCEAFVDEYGSTLLVLVAQEIDPSTMCFQLKMCTNTSALLSSPPREQVVTSLGGWKLDECSVCTTVVDYLAKLLEEDDVDKEITAVVEKVCGVIPASFRGQCTTILEAYGPYILQMIGQVADSKTLCQDIEMCPVPKTHVQLIGGSKCTFGPSYWCRSDAHAVACKAEEFCRNKVW